MTTPQAHVGGATHLQSAVLRLYPAAYRRRHGVEISATLADVAEGEGRLGVLRETAAVAGHALRMRTGLGSARPAGRLLAGLVPHMVAVAASLSAALLAVWPLKPLAWDGERTYAPLAYAPWLVVLGCLLAGRWAWARTAAGAALLGAAVSVPVAYWSGGAEGLSQNLPTVLGLALAALAALAAPPDLPPASTRARRNAALTALALGIPLVVGAVTVFQTVGGPGVMVSARPDPMGLFVRFAPVVLAFPAAAALARVRYGAVAAAALAAAAFASTVPVGWLSEVVPYAAGPWIAQFAFATGVAALAVRLGRRLRSRPAAES